jgi:hypothetical protein
MRAGLGGSPINDGCITVLVALPARFFALDGGLILFVSELIAPILGPIAFVAREL